MSNKLQIPILLASLCLVTGLTSAPAVSGPEVDPETQPALVLAPYVARSDDLSAGQTYAYRPWFENGSWQGDLIQYTLATDGTRTTEVDVGYNPPLPVSDYWTAWLPNWSARARFDAARLTNEDWWRNRNIYTVDSNSDRIEFLWTVLDEDQRSDLDTSTATDAMESPLLNYLRGDRSQERDKADGIFRIRYSVLGAIINSTPSYAAYPADGDPYAKERVYVGANDGMLHAFDAKTGDEVWAFVPSMLIPKLSRHGDVPYELVYMVDGETRYSNAITGYAEDGNIQRKRILTAGLGAGGKGLFALDVDSPDAPEVLWEIHAGSDGSAAHVGHIHGRPAVARIGGTLAASEAFVIAGNGFDSESERAVLLKIRLLDGYVTPIHVIDGGNDDGNGLGAPTLLDLNNDGLVDYAYAGDLKGNLWRFDLNADSAPSKIFAAGESKPITAAPDIARHPFGGIMVYFGTGSVLSAADAANEDQQTIYGIRDLRTNQIDENALVTQTLSVESAFDKQLRVATDNVVDYDQFSGWKVDLPVASERLIGRPQVRGGRLQFVTTITSGDYPAGWLMQLNYLSGASSDTALFDISGDGALDSSDSVTVEDVGQKYPVGRYLGEGNFSQPLLLRLSQGIDVSYINGLLLPFSPLVGAELVFGGNVDVMTDSAAGPIIDKVEGYPNPDGIEPDSDFPTVTHNVDGHVHGYDKIHNVKYVDFVDLEPRRDMWRLDAVLDGDEPFRVEQELNRVTEVIHPDTSSVGIGGDQKFIVTLANADLSRKMDLQIGCRVWNAHEYQQMLSPQLASNTDPSALKDSLHGDQPLVFSLNEILGEDCGEEMGKLRFIIAGQVGRDRALMGTLPGCVNNTLDYDGTPKAEGTHPHITPLTESSGSGFRWRNGALTAQLLRVTPGGLRDYTLQDVGIPMWKEKGQDIYGGYYAKGFDLSVTKGKYGGAVITPLDAYQSGLLYELSMFWDYGLLFEEQQEGQDAYCYGLQGKAIVSIEERGANKGKLYDPYVDAAGRELIENDYADALDELSLALARDDEDAVRLALMNLGDLLKNPDLLAYHNIRFYAPGVVPVQHLLDIDKRLGEGGGGSVADDQTPAEVEDITQDDNPIRGPNFVPGRRTWIDLVPK